MFIGILWDIWKKIQVIDSWWLWNVYSTKFWAFLFLGTVFIVSNILIKIPSVTPSWSNPGGFLVILVGPPGKQQKINAGPKYIISKYTIGQYKQRHRRNKPIYRSTYFFHQNPSINGYLCDSYKINDVSSLVNWFLSLSVGRVVLTTSWQMLHKHLCVFLYKSCRWM